MILVSPAGVLPTLSEIGAYWALLFYLGLPMSLFRALGRIAGSLLLLPILSNPRCARTAYWLQLQTSLAMVNIPAKFIDFSFAASFWNRPQLNHILNSKLPIAMIWGDQDNLLPIETGKLLVSIGHKLGKQFILEPVVGAGHSPFHVNGGNDFAVAMEKVMNQLSALEADTVKAASTAADEQAETEISVQIADVVDLQHGRWRSSFSTAITKSKVLELHAYIIQCVDKFVKN
jgi:pimeloyl-ACP methyl ester carboxylesterase